MFGMKELSSFKQKSMCAAYLSLPVLYTDFEAQTIYSCCIKRLSQPYVLPLYFYWYEMIGCSPAAKSWSSGTNAAGVNTSSFSRYPQLTAQQPGAQYQLHT